MAAPGRAASWSRRAARLVAELAAALGRKALVQASAQEGTFAWWSFSCVLSDQISVPWPACGAADTDVHDGGLHVVRARTVVAVGYRAKVAIVPGSVKPSGGPAFGKNIGAGVGARVFWAGAGQGAVFRDTEGPVRGCGGAGRVAG